MSAASLERERTPTPRREGSGAGHVPPAVRGRVPLAALEARGPTATSSRAAAVRHLLPAGNAVVQRAVAFADGRTVVPPGFPAAHERAVAAGGRPLGPARVHTGADAMSAAASVGARAYTLGRDVVVGEERPGPDLLTHETTHALQQGLRAERARTGLRVSSPEEAAEREAEAIARGEEHQVRSEPATVQRQQALTAPAVARPFDVMSYTNEEFAAEATSAERWVRTHSPSDADYATQSERATQLAAERERRARLGYLWLRAGLTGTPVRLLALSGGPQGFVVADADMRTALGLPFVTSGLIYVTPSQFDALLDDQDVERIDPSALTAPALRPGAEEEELPELAPDVGVLSMETSRAYLPRFGARTEANWARSPDWSGWSGRFGEVAYGMDQPLMSVRDMNRVRWLSPNAPATGPFAGPQVGNYPVADWMTRSGDEVVSVKMSMAPEPIERITYFLGGYAEMLGTQPGTTNLQSFLANQPGLTQADMTRVGRLAVPTEDVPILQQMLSNPTAQFNPAVAQQNWERAPVQRVYDGFLRTAPEVIGNQSYSSVAALETARNAGQITQQQLEQALNRVGQLAAANVRDAGISRAVLADFLGTRGAFPGIGARIRGGTARAAWLRTMRTEWTPARLAGGGEDLSARYAGRGWTGQGLAAGEAGLWGGGFGGLLGGGIAGVQVLMNPEEHPQAGRDIAMAGGLGAVGGATGGAAEQLSASLLMRYFAGSAGGETIGAGTAVFGVRGGAGGAGGGVAGFTIEMLRIIAEERRHSGSEVAKRGGRAAFIGGASGYAAAATTAVVTPLATAGAAWAFAAAGAAGGSIVPGLGTAIGFVVGMGVGLAVGYLLDKALPEVAPDPG